MVHSVSGWTRGVQVKLWDPLRTRAIPERLRGVFTTRRCTNPRLPLRQEQGWRIWTWYQLLKKPGYRRSQDFRCGGALYLSLNSWWLFLSHCTQYTSYSPKLTTHTLPCPIKNLKNSTSRSGALTTYLSKLSPKIFQFSPLGCPPGYTWTRLTITITISKCTKA